MGTHATDSFKNEFIKLDVNLLYRASLLTMHKNKILRDYNITWQQFNILAILRMYHPRCMNLMAISSQMIDPASNTSRLVEKLKQKGLVQRIENEADRRKVDISITQEGLSVHQEAKRAMEDQTITIFSGLSEEDARSVNQLLDRINKPSAD